MTITVTEQSDSRGATESESVDRRYLVNGATTEIEALAALVASPLAPATYNGLVRKRCRVEPAGPCLWLGIAPYGLVSSTKKDPLQVDESSFSFDIAYGTRHITQSIATMLACAPTGMTAPTFYNGIGWDGKNMTGTDVPGDAGIQWTESHCKSVGAMTLAYFRTLCDIVTKSPVNDATFRGFAAGEVMVQRIQGQRRGDEAWELGFTFAYSPNETDLVISSPLTSIEVSAKAGWDYLWVLYGPYVVTPTKCLTKVPLAAYVEMVMLPGDFDLLAIPEAPIA